jgi:ubiquinone/menaquinone biosynthesis C-methylase UbiE
MKFIMLATLFRVDTEVAASVVGVDISDETLQHASNTYKKTNLDFCTGSAVALDFSDDLFDVVVSFETIEHLVEQAQMLAEIRRVLRPDGVLVISSPNRPIYFEESGEHNESQSGSLMQAIGEGIFW